MLQLTFMIYGAACGGAFGLEQMVGNAGPGLAMLLLAVTPFLFSIPLSLAVSELTTTFPVEGGNYRWSRMAFGDFWGFQTGWWAWMSGVVTCGSFAVLFANILVGAFYDPVPDTWGIYALKWVVCLALIWSLCALNLRGIDVVGDSSILLTVLVLLPFAAMCILGLAQWSFNPFTPFIRADQTLLGFGTTLASAIWLYSGYEKLSPVAEEVENPQKVFPPALFIAATLAMLSYLLPTLLALASQGHWELWTDSYFPKVAAQMGGPWLGLSMVVGGLLCNVLLLNVTMMSVSRVPLALAEDGLIPHFFTRLHPRWGTPTASLFFQASILSFLCLFKFTQLLVIYSWFQMTCNLMIYVNVWALRRSHGDLPRPFKIPLGGPGLVLVTAPTCVLALLAMATAVFDDGVFSWKMVLTAAVAMLSGPLLCALGRAVRPDQK
ncbi:APC family permease [bacterium CPR1]|nr:APC family permease [bacterium CPR1]